MIKLPTKEGVHFFNLMLGMAICMLLLGSGAAWAQNLQWAKGSTGTGTFFSQGAAIAHDAAGNIYVAGNFVGTVDFDPGYDTVYVSSNGSNDDVFIVKSDAYGNFIWVKTFGSTLDDVVTSLVLDSAGNVIVAGSFAGSTDFDPGNGVVNRTPIGTADIFLWKGDANGNLLNVNTHGGTGVAVGAALALDGNGSLLMAGEFRGTVDFDPGPGVVQLVGSSTATTDVFIQKLDPAGNLMWVKRIGALGSNDRAATLAIDTADIVIVGGTFSSTVDFDPNGGTAPMTATGALDIFLLKLSAAGNYIWAKHMGAAGAQNHVQSVKINAAGHVISVGDYEGATDFDPGPSTSIASNAGYDDMYVQCLDTNGALLWVRTFGSSGDDIAYDLGLDTAANIYIAGGFQGAIDFDPSVGDTFTLSPAGGLDAFVQCLDASGNFVWAGKVGGQGLERAFAISVFPNGSNLTTGRYGGTADFDPGQPYYVLQPLGATSNHFVMKLGPCAASRSTLAVIGCDSLTYHGITHTATGTYDHLLTNHLGCDSLVSLQLEMRHGTSSTVVVDTCGAFYLNGLVYTTSGTYTQVIPSSLGCDSTITLQLTTRPTSTFTITDSSCSTYTLNGQMYTQSGTYTQTFTNTVGCDSVLTLQLAILSTTHSQAVEACDSFLFGGQMLDSSGVYAHLYVNQFGCDSIEEITLTISQLDAIVVQSGDTLTAFPSGGIYQWVDCNNNNDPISGAFAQSFVPTTSGNYAAVVQYGACEERSACVLFTVVGLPNTQLSDIRAFPSPSIGLVNLDLGQTFGTIDIRVLNLQGQEVKRLSYSQASKLKLELPPSAGLYFLAVEADGHHAVVRVVRL